MVDSVEYEVERSDKPLEIRRYPSMVLATVYGRSDNDAFSILFDYISGDNTPRSKIPMTAPVISSEKTSGERTSRHSRAIWSKMVSRSWRSESVHRRRMAQQRWHCANLS